MNKKIIVFYDAQNFSEEENFIKVKDSIKKHGDISAVRVYHDFVGKDNKWKLLCYKQGLMPCQITRPKKNTADLLITIDAIKLAYQNINDIFCFVSNDSDFGPISLALKEMGKETMLVTSVNDPDINNYYSIVEEINFQKKEQKKLVIAEEIKIPLSKENTEEEFSKIVKYLSISYDKMKKDNEGWATYSTFCSMCAQKYNNIKYDSYGVKSKKDFFIKCGYEIKGLNIRKKK